MLNGFEEITVHLTDKEENVYLPPILQGLRLKVGKEKAVTNKDIAHGLLVNRGIRISDARVRKIINHIRRYALIPCLIATSNGYYIAESEEELLAYEESLESRESAIHEVRMSIMQQRIAKYHSGV